MELIRFANWLKIDTIVIFFNFALVYVESLLVKRKLFGRWQNAEIGNVSALITREVVAFEFQTCTVS